MRLLRKFYFLPIVALTLFSYWCLSKTFFQQDEWASFGSLILREKEGGLARILLDPILISRGHITPLTAYQVYLQLKLFGLSFPFFAYLSILTHIVNSLLVLFLTNLILKNRAFAYLTAFFFAANSISNQAVIWIASSPGTQGAVLFLLLSLIFIFKSFANQEKKTLLYISGTTGFIGLLFKESIIFYFLFVPILWLLYSEKKKWMQFLKFIMPFVFVGAFYLLLRIPSIFIHAPVSFTSAYVFNSSINTYIFRFISFPFKILSQSFIPQLTLIHLSDWTVLHFYPKFILSDGTPNPYISQSVVFDQVVYFLSGIILLIGFLIYKLLMWRGEKNLSKALIFSFILIMLSSFPFVFIPGEAANFSIFEPRDLHVASIGASLLVVLAAYTFTRLFVYNKKYFSIAIFMILLPFLFMHIKFSRTEISKIVDMSTVRKSILATVIKQHPQLPKNAVFYVQSDQAYYGLAEKIPPFQSGLGQTLLVWYYYHDNEFPACFFEKSWLYDLLEQGYRECGGRGFGYFRDKNLLKKEIDEKKFSLGDIIAFGFDSHTNILKDITSEIRKQLK